MAFKNYSKKRVYVETSLPGKSRYKKASEVLGHHLKSTKSVLRNPMGYPVGYIKHKGRMKKIGLIVGSGKGYFVVETNKKRRKKRR